MIYKGKIEYYPGIRKIEYEGKNIIYSAVEEKVT